MSASDSIPSASGSSRKSIWVVRKIYGIGDAAYDDFLSFEIDHEDHVDITSQKEHLTYQTIDFYATYKSIMQKVHSVVSASHPEASKTIVSGQLNPENNTFVAFTVSYIIAGTGTVTEKRTNLSFDEAYAICEGLGLLFEPPLFRGTLNDCFQFLQSPEYKDIQVITTPVLSTIE